MFVIKWLVRYWKEWEKHSDKSEREREREGRGGDRTGQTDRQTERRDRDRQREREKENCVLILILTTLKHYTICYRGFYLALSESRGLEFKAPTVPIKRLVFVPNKQVWVFSIRVGKKLTDSHTIYDTNKNDMAKFQIKSIKSIQILLFPYVNKGHCTVLTGKAWLHYDN